jgi:hypothetical protein
MALGSPAVDGHADPMVLLTCPEVAAVGAAALAASLTAAIDRGAGLLTEAQDRHRRRTRQLERAADLLQELTVSLQRYPATPGGQVDGRSRPAGRDDPAWRRPAEEPVGCPARP